MKDLITLTQENYYTDGTGFSIPEADTTNAGLLGSDMWDKVTGIEAGAEVNVAETDPIFVASDANDVTAQHIIDLDNLSGTNSGDNAVNTLYSGLNTNVPTETSSRHPLVNNFQIHLPNSQQYMDILRLFSQLTIVPNQSLKN